MNRLKITLVAAVALARTVNVFNANKSETVSDMALANVEALAEAEVVLDNRTPSDTYLSLELLGGGCTRITYERLCAYGGSLPCTAGVFTEVDCLR